MQFIIIFLKYVRNSTSDLLDFELKYNLKSFNLKDYCIPIFNVFLPNINNYKI